MSHCTPELQIDFLTPNVVPRTSLPRTVHALQRCPAHHVLLPESSDVLSNNGLVDRSCQCPMPRDLVAVPRPATSALFVTRYQKGPSCHTMDDDAEGPDARDHAELPLSSLDHADGRISRIGAVLTSTCCLQRGANAPTALTNLRCADDVLFFSTSLDKLKDMLCDFKRSTEKSGTEEPPR